MRQRRRQLTSMMLVMTLLVSGIAAAEGEAATDSVAPFSVLANSTISCSVTAPSWILGCFLERPVLVVGALEFAVGVDAQAVLSGQPDARLAPYGILAYYAVTWSAWAELRLPELPSVPVFGSPDWLRVGFTLRIPP